MSQPHLPGEPGRVRASAFMEALEILELDIGLEDDELMELLGVKADTLRRARSRAESLARQRSKRNEHRVGALTNKLVDRAEKLAALLSGRTLSNSESAEERSERQSKYLVRVRKEMMHRTTSKDLRDFTLISYLPPYEALDTGQASAALQAALVGGVRLRYYTPTLEELDLCVKHQVPDQKALRKRWMPDDGVAPAATLIETFSMTLKFLGKSTLDRSKLKEDGYIKVYEFDSPRLPLSLREKICWESPRERTEDSGERGRVYKERINPGEFERDSTANYHSAKHDWMRLHLPLNEEALRHSIIQCRNHQPVRTFSVKDLA